MATQTLPTRTDAARYSFETELDGATYTLDFEWNDRDSGWYVSLTDANEALLLAGRRVVLGFPLTTRYRDSRLPPGLFEAVDTSGTNAEPGYGDLGDRVKLLYTPKADL